MKTPPGGVPTDTKNQQPPPQTIQAPCPVREFIQSTEHDTALVMPGSPTPTVNFSLPSTSSPSQPQYRPLDTLNIQNYIPPQYKPQPPNTPAKQHKPQQDPPTNNSGTYSIVGCPGHAQSKYRHVYQKFNSLLCPFCEMTVLSRPPQDGDDHMCTACFTVKANGDYHIHSQRTSAHRLLFISLNFLPPPSPSS